MHNPLYRLHWVIEKDGLPEDHYSFHKDDTLVTKFIEHVHEENPDPKTRPKLQGPGKNITEKNGRIYNLIINSNKLGFWDHELEKLQLV